MKNCIKEYLDDCKALLPIYSKNEKTIIQRINNNLMEISQEESSLNYGDIVKRFGTPVSLVNAYIENLDTEVLIKNIKRTKMIKKIAIVIIVIVSFISLSVAFYESYRYNRLCEQVEEQQPVKVETTIE